MAEKSNAAACASDYFERYYNLPEKLQGKLEPQAIDIDSIADAIAGATARRLEKALKESRIPEPAAGEDKEKQIAAILEDLDLI